jgi:hypothetical protein
MRRLGLLITGFITGCLLVSACGSDDTATPTGTAGAAGSGGSSGSGGSGGGSTCVGLYSTMTPAAFTAALTSGLACADSADASLICANDVTTDVGTCGVQCYQAHFGDDPGIKSCTADCVNGKLPSALSSACMDCYTTDVICTATNCATQGCLADPAGTMCINCRIQNGCAPGFYGCSGLPVPGTPIGAAGASN